MEQLLYKEEIESTIANSIEIANNRKYLIPSNKKVALFLVISELVEALEAHRKGHYGKLLNFRDVIDENKYFNYKTKTINSEGEEVVEEYNYYGVVLPEMRDDYWIAAYEHFIKHSFESEIAGALVRFLHFCGLLGLEIAIVEQSFDLIRYGNFASYAFDITRHFMKLEELINEGSVYKSGAQASMIVAYILGIKTTELERQEIWDYVSLDLEYFSKRNLKDGKSY